MRTEPPLLLPIFRSANQERVLASIFLGESPKSIQNLSEHLGIPYATLHKEIGRLLEAGLISESKVGNNRLIGSNRKSPYFRPLRDLLEISSGPAPMLKEAMRGIKGIEKVVIFGSWAHRALGHRGPAPEDIDVMVIGHPDVAKIYVVCLAVGKKIGWPINPTIMTEDEWQEDTPFLKNVRKGGVINVFGSSDLKELV